MNASAPPAGTATSRRESGAARRLGAQRETQNEPGGGDCGGAPKDGILCPISGGVESADPRSKPESQHNRHLQPGHQPIHELLYTGGKRLAAFLCVTLVPQDLKSREPRRTFLADFPATLRSVPSL